MEWLTNIYDPKLPDARRLLMTNLHESPVEAWQRHLDWLRDKRIGDPEPTETYTVEQLRQMGYVGVYRAAPRP